MKNKEVITKSAEETKKFAADLAASIIGEAGEKSSATVIALSGDLGGGKTTFSQGFLGHLGIKRATSPTFVLMKRYTIKNLKSEIRNPKQIQNYKSKIQNRVIFHIDAYRLRESRDLLDLDFAEIIKDPNHIVLIEWAERVKDVLPKDTIWIGFEYKGENERKIALNF